MKKRFTAVPHTLVVSCTAVRLHCSKSSAIPSVTILINEMKTRISYKLKDLEMS